MNEYKKNVFIAALVLLAVDTIKATLDHTDPPSFEDSIDDAEIFVTKILQRP